MDRKSFIIDSGKKIASTTIKSLEKIQSTKNIVSDTLKKSLNDIFDDGPEDTSVFFRDLQGTLESPGSVINPYQWDPYDASKTGQKPLKAFIRPPGAASEDVFLQKCTACYKCIDACPYRAIFTYADRSEKADAAKSNGKKRKGKSQARKPKKTPFTIDALAAPVMDPNLEACRLCENYPCVVACPEDALEKKRVERQLPFFGWAYINPKICTRDVQKDNCNYCLEACPIEEAIAARLENKSGRDKITPNVMNSSAAPDSYPLQVRLNRCIGCGLCVRECPTFPKAILVKLVRDNS